MALNRSIIRYFYKGGAFMENKASMTALMSAFVRAYHFKTSDFPVFSDSIAEKLISSEEYSAMAGNILGGIDFFAPEMKGKLSSEDILEYIVSSELAPTPLSRAIYCEECLDMAVKTGTRQYVILGAGYDTFAFRNREFISNYPVFETDHPLTQEDKLKRIDCAGLTVPENLKLVPVDFSTDDLGEKLISAGFDRTKPTLFSWLGVSYYLSEEEICRTLSALAELSAEGSSVIFDFGGEGLFDSSDRRENNMLAMAMAAGEPMKSCFSNEKLSLLLNKYGFYIYELLDPKDIGERYFMKQKHMTPYTHIKLAMAVFRNT